MIPARSDWNAIKRWRREIRSSLIERRRAAPRGQRQEWDRRIERHLAPLIRKSDPGVIDFCWPFKAEFDARALVVKLLSEKWRAALPVVVGPQRPMEFRAWAPDSEMTSGVWGIPVPKSRDTVTPDLVLVPLVGFDRANYRLGYGGGYFDRTLAALCARPLAIGVGYELGRLDSVEPQPHDVPMDFIVTEAGVQAAPRDAGASARHLSSAAQR